MYYKKCPICGNVLKIQDWKEDYYTVETDEKCTVCEYHKNWSYGLTEIEFPGYKRQYRYDISQKEYNNIFKAFNKSRWKYRKSLLRINKIKGRNYKKYF